MPCWLSEPSLRVLEAGVNELFRDTRVLTLHVDALEQIEGSVKILLNHSKRKETKMR